jgi:hypothetical protein
VKNVRKKIVQSNEERKKRDEGKNPVLG